LLVYEACAEAGMKPMEIIQAATRNAAELLGMSDRIGTLEAGKLADIISVPGDPGVFNPGWACVGPTEGHPGAGTCQVCDEGWGGCGKQQVRVCG